MDMNAMNSVSRAPGHLDASPYAALSRLQRSHAREWSDAPFDYDRGRRMHDRTRPNALERHLGQSDARRLTLACGSRPWPA
jgi:hypothetical protein